MVRLVHDSFGRDNARELLAWTPRHIGNAE